MLNLKRKKAATSPSIVLIAVMTLALYSSAWFVYHSTNAKFESSGEQAYLVFNVYASEERARLFLDEVLESAAIESYKEEAKRSEPLSAYIDGDSLSDIRILEEVRNKFLEKINKMDISHEGVSDKIIDDLKNKIIQGSYTLDYFNGELVLRVGIAIEERHYREKGIIYKSPVEDISIFYKNVLNISFDVDADLHSFEVIKKASADCRKTSVEEYKSCLMQRLPNFEIIVSEQGSDYMVLVTSKDSFLIGDQLEEIEFSFLQKKN